MGDVERDRGGNGPLVTIGLPVLDGERFLGDALDSLLSQEVSDLEVIISDNASTDSTPQIAQRYAELDRRIRYMRHDQRRGASFNFNFVARAARGRYFKWAAHDDVCGPNFLSACIDVLQRDPAAVLCYPQAAEIDEYGSVIRRFPAYHFAHEQEPAARVRSFLVERPACLETYGVMRRRTLLDTRMIGPFSSSDGVFLLEMMLRGRFRSIEDLAFYSRKHPGRSLVQHQGSRRQWYDGSASGGRGFPEWRLAAELVRSIAQAPIDASEKVRCGGHVASWAVRKAPELVHDVVATARATVQSLSRGSERDRSGPAVPSRGGER